MDNSKQYLSFQTNDVMNRKSKSFVKKNRRKQTLRRASTRGLPAIATNTVKMVVATLTFTPTTDDDFSDDEEQDDDIFSIGQQVQAHIPDIVLNDLIDQKGNIVIPSEHYYNKMTLLFLDVSGFTSLTEQYSNDAHLGIDQLTHTLNSYFDKIVSQILIDNGDIYKFAGDAILALWTHETRGPEQALKCAFRLQDKCGSYETDVGVVLRLKIAIAYGPVRALFVGTDEFKHYILAGDCVKDINICEQLCEPGDIIITQAFYEQIQSLELNCEFLSVKDDINGKDAHIAVKYSGTINEQIRINDKIVKNLKHESHDQEHISNHKISSTVTDIMDEEVYNKIDNLMKSFLLRCVYQRIERQQPLDYLSELRRVTITFINLDISNDECTNKNLCQNIQKVFVQIYELTKMMGGVLTKALLFDKGWSFLCVFGLPGYKQGDDTANALKCAQMIHSTMHKKYKFIDKCSIGVATGLTYCGVVGHFARCEYTVIGRKVNMSARLMCNYSNIISCDQETYYNSHLNTRCFQILPDKILKGMNNVGIIWQYGDCLNNIQMQNNPTFGQNQIVINDIRHENYPFLGRRIELMIVATQIVLLDDPLNRRRDLAAIIFEGDDKIGRSRLLQYIADSFENANHNTSSTSDYTPDFITHEFKLPIGLSLLTDGNEHDGLASITTNTNDSSSTKLPIIRVIKYSCRLEQRFNEFSLLRGLLRQLLQFHNNDKTQYEREQYLYKLFDVTKPNDLYLRRNLFLLNDLLDVRFRRRPTEIENNNENNFVRTYEANINELLLHIVNQLIEPCTTPTETSINIVTPLSSSFSQLRLSTSSMATLTNTPISTVSKILFIIDDIHFADESSLKHLLTLGSHSKCLLILSMRPPHNNYNDRSTSSTLQSISTDSRVYLRRLPGLELRYLATLACQILSVHKIPAKIVKVLNESCNGIPGFCEQILFDLLRKDKIYISTTTDVNDEDLNLIEGDADKLVANNPIKTNLLKTLFSRRKQTLTDEQYKIQPIFSRVCQLRDATANDFIAHCEQNFQNYIMCRIDRLSDGESLLVKIASVIGNTFSRTFLWQLVDPQSRKLININECILDMMQRTVIECAYQQQQKHRSHAIKCFCLQNLAGFPSQCRLMAFTHVSIREGVYNSLTDGLKRTLIRNAIDYLEKQCKIVCLTCGPRNDTPFFIQKQDALSRNLKTPNHHAFVDIVKMVALKEIDDLIKQSIKLRSMSSPLKPRSNTSADIEADVNIVLKEIMDKHDNKSSHKIQENRRNSFDPSGMSVHHRSRNSQPQCHNLFDTDIETKTNKSQRHPSNDSSSTLLTVYPYRNNKSESSSSPIDIEIQQPSSLSSSASSRIFTLFKLSKSLKKPSLSKTQLIKSNYAPLIVNKSNDLTTIVDKKINKRKSITRSNRFRSFIDCIFCHIIPFNSDSSVKPTDMNNVLVKNSNEHTILDVKNSLLPNNILQSNRITQHRPSHWKKVREKLIPAPSKIRHACPSDSELLQRPMISSDLMNDVLCDLECLNQQIYRIQTFQNLYEQSLLFHTFQSYVQYKNLIEYAFETKQKELDDPNLDKYVNEFTNYNDLRICQCADYVLTIYIKLVEYHTNLYNLNEKLVDETRDYLHRKQFERIIYYRTEICQLLLRLNCLQRLLVEIENGRKSFQQYQDDIVDKDNPIYKYQYILTKYTYNLFEATVLQRTRSIYDAKLLCEQSLEELKTVNQEKLWESLISNTDLLNFSSANEKRAQYEQTKDYIINISTNSQTSQCDQLYIFSEKYRLGYLMCQYHFLQYQLSRDQSFESVNNLISLEYYMYPITFSLPCTITLIEYFYLNMDYNQCLSLIDKYIKFWWLQITPREKLELGKLKSLSLIIQLKQGKMESAILSGYFAKRLLTGYHENIFLIETCIHLTLALIGEMRISNIELILQHLEYLSEQTMNCYAKLWYYILVVDVAIELGYELMPITNEFLENITKYRKKLLTGPNQRSLLIVYSDCTLAQIYIRLGVLNASKIHFQQALHQIKYDQMHLTNIDFRFQRSLLKLIETQLLYWYHTKENQESIQIYDFLVHALDSHVNDKSIPWNRTRFFIYRAYYDRLINDYKRKKNYSIDNDYDWKFNLEEAEMNAIKLDLEWIRQLRTAWLRTMSEQLSYQINQSLFIERPRTSTVLSAKSTPRPFIRPSVPHIKISLKTDNNPDEQTTINIHNYSHQKFVDWRLFLTHNTLPKFQLYILPVRV